MQRVCRKKYSLKNISLTASIMTGGLSLDDRTKDYVDRKTGGQVYMLHEVTHSRWKFAYLSGRTKKIISRKLKYNFSKNYTAIMRTCWATKLESRSESKFWVTCRCLSDACQHHRDSARIMLSLILWCFPSVTVTIVSL